MAVDPDAVQHALIENLLLYRDRRGMTTGQLAKAAGLSPSYLYKVLAGSSSPTLASICKLANALRVKPDRLLNFGRLEHKGY